jgi:hypothetical protein
MQKPLDTPPITDVNSTLPSANTLQIGGDHYRKYGNLQPWDAIVAWGCGYLDGAAIKYIARYKDKGGINDLKKAIHYLQKLIEVLESSPSAAPTEK